MSMPSIVGGAEFESTVSTENSVLGLSKGKTGVIVDQHISIVISDSNRQSRSQFIGTVALHSAAFSICPRLVRSFRYSSYTLIIGSLICLKLGR
jgi:hypothetical protein